MSTFIETMTKVKEELKEDGKSIRTLKESRKQRNRTRALWQIQLDINRKSFFIRHKHIAYCEMRFGTARTLIEHPRKDNLPIEKLITDYKSEWEAQIDEEALCASTG